MKRRLLLDSEVVVRLEEFPASLRRLLWARLRAIAETPDRFADYHERDEHGRDLPVHIFRGYAILYWDDHADRQVKILEITDADES